MRACNLVKSPPLAPQGCCALVLCNLVLTDHRRAVGLREEKERRLCFKKGIEGKQETGSERRKEGRKTEGEVEGEGDDLICDDDSRRSAAPLKSLLQS